MRLRDYQKLLEDNIPNILTITGEGVPNNSSVIKLRTYITSMNAIHAFENSNLFPDLIEKIKQFTEVYNNNYEPFIIASNDYNTISSIVEKINEAAKSFKATLDRILSEENENSVNFKLPKYSSIDELIEFFNDLKPILSVFQYQGVKAEFQGFDTGSEWIQFLLNGTYICAPLLYIMADKSLILRNKKLEGDKYKAEIEKLKSEKLSIDIKNVSEIINKIDEIQLKERTELKEKLIEQIIVESGVSLSKNNNRNEFKTRIGLALDKLGGLIEKGMKIVPAISAPSEIKELSLSLDKQIDTYQAAYLGISEMKLLTNNINETIEEDSNKAE